MRNVMFNKLLTQKLNYIIFLFIVIVFVNSCGGKSSPTTTSTTTATYTVATEAKDWTKYSSNPVYSNYAPNPALSFTGDPGVYYYNGTFYMWYASLVQFNVPDVVPYGPCNATMVKCALPIELATSTDGITWKKFDRGTSDLTDDYVLVRDSENSWDAGTIETPAIVFNTTKNKFMMWYSATRAIDDLTERSLTLKIGYAESSDGITWTKYDVPTTTDVLYAKSDPVLDIRTSNWDSLFVADPTVIKDGTKYKMWYGGAYSRGSTTTASIGYAESDDGITWTRLDKPVLESTEAEGFLMGPHVLKVNNIYEMWYYTKNISGIFYAVSSDGISWEKKGQLIPVGSTGSWDALETSSPSVIYEQGKYYLFYTGSTCPLEEEKRTDKNCTPHIKIGLATK